jgi:3-oxoadipate enol-lactonase
VLWSLEHGMVVRRTGGGPCIVWIHGLGESSISFEGVVAALPQYAHVLVDLPGYGRSPWPDDAVDLAESAARFARWLANEPPAVLVGHSMGGVLATLIAEQAPVRGVVNVDGNVTRGDCSYSALAAEYSLADFRAHGFAAIRSSIFEDGARRPDLRGYYASMALASPDVFHKHAVDLLALSSSDTLAPLFAALRAPKLYIAGVPDGACAATCARLDELAIPFLGIEPAGHWVYLDQTARFVAAVDQFACAL